MSPPLNLVGRSRDLVQALADIIQTWPWLDTARTLRERFREDRLGLTASSLTFTTLIALVPLVTVMLAIFSAFPMFAGFQLALETYFVQNLVPVSIAQPVLKALTQFASKATQMGSVSLAALGVTAFALVLTIDRTLNAIWRVRRKRPLTQRVLVYWAALTLGPLLVGMSLTVMTYALTNTTRTSRIMGSSAELALAVLEFVLFVLGVAALFRFVPNTDVRWRHALGGAFFVAVGLQLAKKGLAWYAGSMSLFTTVYGAFAILPILLLWLYLMWVVVLLGAVIAAYAPSLSMRIVRPGNTAGHRFSLAVSLLRELHAVRTSDARGWSIENLAQRLRTDPLLLEPIIETLLDLDWIARIEEAGAQRLVLLIQPASTPSLPLMDRMLLAPTPTVTAFRTRAQFQTMMLDELL